MLVLVDHQKIISTHSSTGAALSDKGLMAAGVTIDFAAVNLGHVALLNLHLFVIVFAILGNLSISLGYNHSSLSMLVSLSIELLSNACASESSEATLWFMLRRERRLAIVVLWWLV